MKIKAQKQQLAEAICNKTIFKVGTPIGKAQVKDLMKLNLATLNNLHTSFVSKRK